MKLAYAGTYVESVSQDWAMTSLERLMVVDNHDQDDGQHLVQVEGGQEDMKGHHFPLPLTLREPVTTPKTSIYLEQSQHHVCFLPESHLGHKDHLPGVA